MNSVVGLVNGWRSQLIEQDEERIDSQSRAGCMLPAVWRNGRLESGINFAGLGGHVTDHRVTTRVKPVLSPVAMRPLLPVKVGRLVRPLVEVS